VRWLSLGFQVVIACLGNHAIKNQPSLIDTALAGGVRHWYPSEFGADLTVGDNWNERYYRDKVLTRIHLQKRAHENPGFGYTYFINGRFTEWAPIPHFGIDMKTHTAHIVGEPDMEQSLISVKEYEAIFMVLCRKIRANVLNEKVRLNISFVLC
jgi:hypothetical protein